MMRMVSAAGRYGVCVPGARKEQPVKNGCEKGKLTALGQVETTGMESNVERLMSAGTAFSLRPRKEVMMRGICEESRAEAMCHAAWDKVRWACRGSLGS